MTSSGIRNRDLHGCRSGVAALLLSGLVCLFVSPAVQGQDVFKNPLGNLTEPKTRAEPSESGEVVKVSHKWSQAEVHTGGYTALAVTLQMTEHYHIQPNGAQLPEDSLNIPTSLKAKAPPVDLVLGKVQYPKAKDYEGGTVGKVPGYGETVTLFVPVLVKASTKPGDLKLTLTLTIQACNEQGTCYRPSDIPIEATLQVVPPDTNIAGAIDQQLFKDFDSSVYATLASGAATIPDRGGPSIDGKTKGSKKDPGKAIPSQNSSVVKFDAFGLISFSIDSSTTVGMILLFLVAALGGFCLNFTPCVLPVIPLKIMALTQAAHGSRSKSMVLGASMFLGIVSFWLFLGGLVAGISQFQGPSQLFKYPAFSITVGLVIAVMGLGMFGLFTFRLPQWVYRINPRHDTLHGSFGFGVMAAVLSTPCTAPFMGAALGWAIAQSAVLNLVTFAAIGLGMGAPYLVLSAYPKLLEKMPRTGPASELIKQMIGFGILAAAAYFIGLGVVYLIKPADQEASQLYWMPIFGIIAAGGLWLAYRTFKIRKRPLLPWAFVAVGVLVFMLSAGQMLVLLTESGVKPGSGTDSPTDFKANWVYFTPERYAEHKGKGKVVVLEFTAEWCPNCKWLEKYVLYTSQVHKALGQADVVAFKVDLSSDEAWDLLRTEGATGPPLLVVYGKNGKKIFTSNAYQISQVVDAIQQAQSTRMAQSP